LPRETASNNYYQPNFSLDVPRLVEAVKIVKDNQAVAVRCLVLSGQFNNRKTLKAAGVYPVLTIIIRMGKSNNIKSICEASFLNKAKVGLSIVGAFLIFCRLSYVAMNFKVY